MLAYKLSRPSSVALITPFRPLLKVPTLPLYNRRSISTNPPPLPDLLTSNPPAIGHFESVGLHDSIIWPTGIFQRVFEYVHVYTGLPWWATIISVTLATRLALLPMYIKSAETSAKMNTVKNEMSELTLKSRSNDPEQVKQAMFEQQQLFKTHNIQPLNMVKPLLSVPIFLGMFNSLRGMAGVPIIGFANQGILWFKDLSAADPYCGLQILTAGLYFASFRYFGGEIPNADMKKNMKLFSLVMPWLAIPLTRTLPAGICLYFAVNALFGIVQSYILRSPRIRSALRGKK